LSASRSRPSTPPPILLKISDGQTGSPDKPDRQLSPDKLLHSPSSESCGYLKIDVIVEDTSERSKSSSQSCLKLTAPSAFSSTARTHTNTLIHSSIKCRDLISFLLLKLGYLTNKSDSPIADIFLIVSQWRPISIKTLNKSGSQSLAELLSPFSSLEVVSLKIVIENWKTKDLVFKWNNEAVRTTLASLLRHYSQKKLATLCPFSQAYISMIARNNNSVIISQPKCLEFGTWFENFTKKVISSASVSGQDVRPNKYPNGTSRPDSSTTTSDSDTTSNCDSPSSSVSSISSSALSLIPSNSVFDGKPLQISFHAQLELPLLKQWFSATTSPSDAEFISFTRQLNESEWRRFGGRIRVTKDKLRNWWKNERARRKRMRSREEIRVKEEEEEETRVGEGKQRKRKRETVGIHKISKNHDEICRGVIL